MWLAVILNLSDKLIVVVGGTSGIGESTARAFAQHTFSPLIYLIGRNKEQASKIAREIHQDNQNCNVIFLKKDVCGLRAVDEACREIQASEEEVNLLFLSPGISRGGEETQEGLDKKLSLHYYSRMHFIVNLLPQLAEGSQTLIESCERPLILEGLPLKWNYSLCNCAVHAITMTSLSMEVLARAHPSTSFIHTYPGIVNTNLTRDMRTVAHLTTKALLSVACRWIVPLQESGQRHLNTYLYLRFPCSPKYDEVELDTMAAYLLDHRGFPRQNLKLLKEYLANGNAEKVWKHTVDTFAKVCGDRPESE
ncbi:oxidoreductase andH [Lipomyces orientalis]|uniref:Oxidoreductase andH n=1 Tax=Lipomyces orientalis TaxID=1233043 RepID=A0ACC3TDM3_9ASCO